MKIPNTNLTRVVIIGSGFGGLQVAIKLNKKLFQIVLIDKNNYHTFQPLLYQVATFGLEPDSIAKSIRTIINKYDNFFLRLAKVYFINKINKIIYSNIGELYYDYLIIATGSKTNFFGKKKIEKYSFPMKNIGEALNLRNCILHNFEYALSIKKKINFVIVGGGPTGVELAGSLAELKHYILPRDYPELDFSKMKIHLIQATEKLLDGMSKDSSNIALKYMKKMGVNVWLNNPVIDFDGKTIFTKKGKFKSYNVIWAAGVKGAIIKGLGEKYLVNNRIIVDVYNKVKVQGISNLFAIGDVAIIKGDEEYPNGHPMVALPAIQQGIHLALNFNRFFFKKKIKPFKFKNKGSMAIIGRNKAVCDFSNFTLSGFSAWIIWMFIHLIKIVGFRNKLLTLINWITQYKNYNKSISLLIRPYVIYNKFIN